MEGCSGATDFGQDVLDGGNPGEHAGASVVVRNVRLDRHEQLPHLPVDLAPQAPGGEAPEPSLDEIEP